MISSERIMGFIEGEGCFGVAIATVRDTRPRKTGRKLDLSKPSLGFQVKPSFRIVQASKDRAILDEIQAHFRNGYVYDLARLDETHLPASQYVVQKLEDLRHVIEFFDQQIFYTTKGESYQIWKEIVQMVSRKEHLSKPGFIKICEMREKMNLISNKEKRLRSSQKLAKAVENVARGV
jgi:hypothetical protein